jgi:ribosome biogenesis GTPase / thiamine phosphate phosphatase
MTRKKKIRTELRKNRAPRTRKTDLTQQFSGSFDEDRIQRQERIGKGEQTRRRTVVGQEAESQDAGFAVVPDVDSSLCLRGRVLSVRGLVSDVETDDAQHYQCATRRLLRTLATDQRHVVAAGDVVLFRPLSGGQGIIDRVEPRHGVLSRQVRGRQHVLVANLDQLLIVASAAEPYLKPNLIDRMLVAADRAHIRPLICINKIDLVEPSSLVPLIGVYSQLGYRVLSVSARTGFGVDRLRRAVAGLTSTVAGQSGVGKSSLLNVIEPGLDLRIAQVSRETQKGRHTTTTAQLFPLSIGGYLVDTPGIRQFQLWDVSAEEVSGFYREIRPLESLCRFPDCTHTHEAECAVKDAVADGLVDARRYESYCHMRAGELEG